MTTQTPQPLHEMPTTHRSAPRPAQRNLVRNAMLIGGGAMLLLVAGLSASSLTRQQETTAFTASGIRTIVVEVEAGNVTFLPSTGSDVEVTTTRRWSFTEATAEHQIDNGVLTVTAECSWPSFGCSVSEQLKVPAGVTVRVETAAGNIEAADLDVESLEARTAAGNVTASLVGAPSDITVSTSAGNVDVLVPRATYRVDAEAALGQVDVEVPTADDARSSIRVETAAGNIHIGDR